LSDNNNSWVITQQHVSCVLLFFVCVVLPFWSYSTFGQSLKGKLVGLVMTVIYRLDS